MLQAAEVQEDADTDEALLSVAEKWEPDPVDADSSTDTCPQDVISMLVGIYGSKELFINEYRCADPLADLASGMHHVSCYHYLEAHSITRYNIAALCSAFGLSRAHLLSGMMQMDSSSKPTRAMQCSM